MLKAVLLGGSFPPYVGQECEMPAPCCAWQGDGVLACRGFGLGLGGCVRDPFWRKQREKCNCSLQGYFLYFPTLFSPYVSLDFILLWTKQIQLSQWKFGVCAYYKQHCSLLLVPQQLGRDFSRVPWGAASSYPLRVLCAPLVLLWG